MTAGYEIISLIGSGGMGSVYKARHTALDRIVALKILHKHLLDDRNQSRFHREAQNTANLRHPNLVSTLNCGTINGAPFISMEYLEGITLDSFIKERGALTPAASRIIMSQIADALSYVHEQGIVHRDLKPANIMLVGSADPPQVKVLDFGIAYLFTSDNSQRLTGTDNVCGSPLYMSPEHCLSGDVDPRTDIYSLGCVMYHCLTGQPPYTGETAFQIMYHHINDTAPRVQHKGQEAKLLADIIAGCLRKKPEDRYACMADIVEDLQTGACRFGSRYRQTRKVTMQKKLRVPVALAVFVVTALLLLPRDPARTPPPAGSNPTARAEMLAASDAWDKHNFREAQRKALHSIELARQSDPEIVRLDALKIAGLASLELGDGETARRVFSEEVKLKEKHRKDGQHTLQEAAIALIRACIVAHKESEARDVALHVLSIKPLQNERHSFAELISCQTELLCNQRVESDRAAEHIARYTPFFQTMPRGMQLEWNLQKATIYQRCEQKEKALREIRELVNDPDFALSIPPNDQANALTMYGDLSAYFGQITVAQQCYRKALQVGRPPVVTPPIYVRARVGLASTKNTLNRARALQELTALLEELQSKKGTNFKHKNELEFNNDLRIVLRRRGEFYNSIGKHDVALADFKEALAIQPPVAEHTAILSTHIAGIEKLSDRKKARETLQHTYELLRSVDDEESRLWAADMKRTLEVFDRESKLDGTTHGTTAAATRQAN